MSRACPGDVVYGELTVDTRQMKVRGVVVKTATDATVLAVFPQAVSLGVGRNVPLGRDRTVCQGSGLAAASIGTLTRSSMRPLLASAL